MADRTSSLQTQIEYIEEHKDRISSAQVEIEYVGEHRNRSSQVMLMIEWRPPSPHIRKFGPAIQ